MMPSMPKYVFIDDSTLQRVNAPNVLRSDMEVGPQKTRQIQSVPLFQVAMSISVCKDDFNSWRQFFNTDLRHGSLWFLMKDPFDGTLRRWRFVETDLTWAKLGTVMVSQVVIESYDEL